MRQPGELRGIEGPGQIADVNEVMRHAGAVGGRRLGRAEVESAIDLHGIGGNDFATEQFRDAQGDSRFSNRSRPGDQNRERMEDGGLKMAKAILHLPFSIFVFFHLSSFWFSTA